MTLRTAPPRSFARLVAGALLTVSAAAAASDDWPQWGGPERNFHIDGQLAATWPPEGPRMVWRRLVGDGYSAVAAAGGAVYTLYRAREDEVAIALDATTGERLWSHRYPAPIPRYMRNDRGLGPRSTPLVTADHVFVIGVRGTLQALDRASGSPVWRRNISTPLWNGVDRLFLSSVDGGSRMLRLQPSGGAISVEELWHSKRLRVQFTNALWRGGVIYASNGSTGPVPLTGVAAESGQILWRDRAFARAHLVQVGDRTLLLDEDGTLAVIALSAEGVRIDASSKLLSGGRAWTAPTVAGRRVYVRTRSRVLALELPSAHGPQ